MARRSPKTSPRRRRRRAPRKRRRGLRRAGLALALVLCTAVGGGLVWLDTQVRAQFEGKRWAVPARVYARPLDLYPGLRLTAEALVLELEAAGYREAPGLERPGSYARRADTFSIRTRRFRFWDGTEPARRLRVRVDAGRVAGVESEGRAVAPVRLEPALIGRIYPAHHEDRVLVRLEEVPRTLVAGLMAVEDRDFKTHYGVSPKAIARALLANLRAGQTVQGGSTLTQQLARNFFLTRERTLWRKLREAAIAVILELRYDKAEILEAYLNEVFLGQQGQRAIHGFGLAARYYFGRPLEELDLAEQALLVALVRGPSYYDPRRHPERARERRDLVLRLMAEQGVIDAERAAAVAARPLGVTPEAPAGRSPHPAFLELVRRQLVRDYREADLRSEGLRIFTTLSPRVQARAEAALARGVRRLQRERGLEAEPLQGAVVVTDAQNGQVRALVGGRDPRDPGFNRALDARRPVGSLIKPAVYLTALERPEAYTLGTLVDDAPIQVRDAKGRTWTPKNYDEVYHGRVPLYLALAHSYNVATVRLGMTLGLENVLETLHRLGLERPLGPYPSLLLGAVELSPLEVARIYQTLASGGFRTPLRAIREVTDAQGAPLKRYALSPGQAFAPDPVYLLTRALQEVVHVGTARSLSRTLDPTLGVAGKTGTTDGLRDSWFAGFTAHRLAVVWLGLDSNRPAGLTGAGGALPVFAELMAGLHPRPLAPEPPERLVWHWTDQATGRRTDARCPGATRLPYLRGSAPAYASCAGLAHTEDGPARPPRNRYLSRDTPGLSQ